MNFFYSSGSNNSPDFTYRLKVREVTSEMFLWAKEYPDHNESFRRFHVEYAAYHHGEYEVIQFEWLDAYLAFKWAFAGEIIEDLTYIEYKV